jgi:hypothetical protein
MLRDSSTPSTHVYYFLHLLFIWIQMIGLRDLWRPCWRTEKYWKKRTTNRWRRGQKCVFDLLEKKLIDVQEDNYLTLDDSIKFIFDITKSDTAQTGNQWWEKHCLYISPAILNKSWMIQVKKIAKDQLQFCMVRDLEYDGANCYDFAHTILQKHVMDLTSKWYKRYLEKFGMKLLTKLPKKEFFHMMMSKFTSIMQNSTPIWKQLIFIASCLRRLILSVNIQRFFPMRLTLSHLTLGQGWQTHHLMENLLRLG